jgi:hypothetical protein
VPGGGVERFAAKRPPARPFFKNEAIAPLLTHRKVLLEAGPRFEFRRPAASGLSSERRDRKIAAKWFPVTNKAALDSRVLVEAMTFGPAGLDAPARVLIAGIVQILKASFKIRTCRPIPDHPSHAFPESMDKTDDLIRS